MAAQTARKSTASKSTAPAFDLSALTVQDAELPKQTRQGNAGPNPFADVIAQSRANNGAGKSVTVPAANVGQVQYLIRRAASDNNCGARIVLRDSKGQTLDKAAFKALPKSATVTVLFAAKDRKQRKSTTQSA